MTEHSPTSTPDRTRHQEHQKQPSEQGPVANEAETSSRTLLSRTGVGSAPASPRDIFADTDGARRGGDRLRTAYTAQLQRTHGNRHVAQLLTRPAAASPIGQAPEVDGATERDGIGAEPIDRAPAQPEAEQPLTHASDGAAAEVARSVDAPMVQRGWFSDAVNAVGGAISSAASAVGNAVKSTVRAIGGAAQAIGGWLTERARDVGMWVVNLFRDLPGRLLRLGQTLVDGMRGIVTFIPEAIGALINGGVAGLGRWFGQKLLSGLAWAGTLVSRVFDLIGGPEIAEFILHLLGAGTTPITGAERQAAQRVLGPGAIRWDDVRVSEGGLLEAVIFRLNNRRAFTTAHTINMPRGGRDLATMVHELTHVYQYEKVGSVYIGQAIHAQATAGYSYGGKAGLAQRRAAGQHFRDLNREQQAQLAEDYFDQNLAGDPDYEPFIAELKAGQL